MRSQPTARRLALAMAFAAVLSLATAAPASAKMPYLTVEIDPAVPTSGEPFLIIVLTWEDAAHTIPAGFAEAEALRGLLVARRPSGDSADIAIPLLLREPDRFEARVILPTGNWMIVAFPNRAGWSSPNVPVGYPDAIPLSVREPSPDRTGFAMAVVVAAAIAAITLVRRPRIRSGLSVR